MNLTVTETRQYFATEGYPDSYKNNQDCHINFEAPPGMRFVVFFLEFNLELHVDFLHFRKLLFKTDSQTNNTYDILENLPYVPESVFQALWHRSNHKKFLRGCNFSFILQKGK